MDDIERVDLPDSEAPATDRPTYAAANTPAHAPVTRISEIPDPGAATANPHADPVQTASMNLWLAISQPSPARSQPATLEPAIDLPLNNSSTSPADISMQLYDPASPDSRVQPYLKAGPSCYPNGPPLPCYPIPVHLYGASPRETSEMPSTTPGNWAAMDTAYTTNLFAFELYDLLAKDKRGRRFIRNVVQRPEYHNSTSIINKKCYIKGRCQQVIDNKIKSQHPGMRYEGGNVAIRLMLESKFMRWIDGGCVVDNYRDMPDFEEHTDDESGMDGDIETDPDGGLGTSSIERALASSEDDDMEL